MAQPPERDRGSEVQHRKAPGEGGQVPTGSGSHQARLGHLQVGGRLGRSPSRIPSHSVSSLVPPRVWDSSGKAEGRGRHASHWAPARGNAASHPRLGGGAGGHWKPAWPRAVRTDSLQRGDGRSLFPPTSTSSVGFTSDLHLGRDLSLPEEGLLWKFFILFKKKWFIRTFRMMFCMFQETKRLGRGGRCSSLLRSQGVHSSRLQNSHLAQKMEEIPPGHAHSAQPTSWEGGSSPPSHQP